MVTKVQRARAKLASVPTYWLVSIKFANSTFRSHSYTYLSDINGIERGDKVVIVNGNGIFEIVEVTNVAPLTSKTIDVDSYKWVVDKIDMTGYLERSTRVAQRARVAAELERRKKQVREQLISQAIEEDSVVQALTRQLNLI